MNIQIISNNYYFTSGIIDSILCLYNDHDIFFSKLNFLVGSKTVGNRIKIKANLVFLDLEHIKKNELVKHLELVTNSVSIFLINKHVCDNYFLTKQAFNSDNVTLNEADTNILNLTNFFNVFMTSCLLKSKPNQSQEKMTNSLTNQLTVKEMIIIECYMRGWQGKEIAQILNKSEKTISAQKRNAMLKLGVKNNNELIMMFLNYDTLLTA